MKYLPSHKKHNILNAYIFLFIVILISLYIFKMSVVSRKTKEAQVVTVKREEEPEIIEHPAYKQTDIYEKVYRKKEATFKERVYEEREEIYEEEIVAPEEEIYEEPDGEVEEIYKTREYIYEEEAPEEQYEEAAEEFYVEEAPEETYEEEITHEEERYEEIVYETRQTAYEEEIYKPEEAYEEPEVEKQSFYQAVDVVYEEKGTYFTLTICWPC